MTKYIEATNIYASWMIRKQTLAISNLQLTLINTQLIEKLKQKNDYHIFNLGEYDKEYFIKGTFGLECKDNVKPSTLMSLISRMDMDTYLDISNSIEEIDFPTPDFLL